jgi:hypothetical protein
MDIIEEQYNRRAALLLTLVREELSQGAGQELPSVRLLISEAAERAGFAVQVEVRARDAWATQERLARPYSAGEPKRMAMLALAQAALLLRLGGRVAA